jgi:hypothetical protein
MDQPMDFAYEHQGNFNNQPGYEQFNNYPQQQQQQQQQHPNRPGVSMNQGPPGQRRDPNDYNQEMYYQ